MLRNLLIMSRFKLKGLKLIGRSLNLSSYQIIMDFLLGCLSNEERGVFYLVFLLN